MITGTRTSRSATQPHSKIMKYTDLKELILSNVKIDSKTGCWNWIPKPDNKMGYCRTAPSQTRGGKRVGVHRLAFQLWHRPKSMPRCVCHKCDNPRCCNPDHLFGGTHKDNTMDMMKKGRCNPRRGDRSGLAKLTNGQARAIFLCQGRQAIIANHYGVSQSTVSLIKSRKHWRSVNGGVR